MKKTVTVTDDSKDARMSMRISTRLRSELEAFCVAEGKRCGEILTYSDVIRDALTAWVNRRG